MISYEAACDIVFSAKKFGICLGLKRMELILKELGNPERNIPAIHLAGTNGKGSTLTYLAAIFQEAGYSVGTYTSPAIHKINDKIKVDQLEISDQDFAKIVEQLQPIIEKVSQTNYGPPTEFEILTAVAFQYFAMQKPDIILIETGLGGRLDSTNVITPLVSIITNIGHDHMDILGDTIEAVAKEKAGIIKETVPVVSGCKQEEALEIMNQTAQLQSSYLYQLGKNFSCEHQGDQFAFHYGDLFYSNLKTSMLGKHQQVNASLALMAVHCLKNFTIPEQAIRNGLVKAKIANRIEVVEEEPMIIFDGGHNLEGMAALASTLATSFSNRNIYVLFCAMKDKDINAMLTQLEQVALEIVLTSFDYERAMDPSELGKDLNKNTYCHVVTDWHKAYTDLHGRLEVDDILVITGSLYFLQHVRNELKI